MVIDKVKFSGAPTIGSEYQYKHFKVLVTEDFIDDNRVSRLYEFYPVIEKDGHRYDIMVPVMHQVVAESSATKEVRFSSRKKKTRTSDVYHIECDRKVIFTVIYNSKDDDFVIVASGSTGPAIYEHVYVGEEVKNPMYTKNLLTGEMVTYSVYTDNYTLP